MGEYFILETLRSHELRENKVPANKKCFTVVEPEPMMLKSAGPRDLTDKSSIFLTDTFFKITPND